MRCRKQLQRTLAPRFLVAATQRMKLFPGSGFDNGQRDAAAGNHRLDCAGGPAIFESARGALFRRRLGALDERVLRNVMRNPVTDREHVDALLGAHAGDQDVDRIDEARSGVRAYGYDRQAAADAGVDAENEHHGCSSSDGITSSIAANAVAKLSPVNSARIFTAITGSPCAKSKTRAASWRVWSFFSMRLLPPAGRWRDQ